MVGFLLFTWGQPSTVIKSDLHYTSDHRYYDYISQKGGVATYLILYQQTSNDIR